MTCCFGSSVPEISSFILYCQGERMGRSAGLGLMVFVVEGIWCFSALPLPGIVSPVVGLLILELGEVE
jgi:hypothetical protein